MSRVVLWDFDGTLARRGAVRPGAVRSDFSACLIEELDSRLPGHEVDPPMLRPFLATGFPWHRADEPHPELCEPEAWWGSVVPLLARALEGVGVPGELAAEVADSARERYVDPRHWCLYSDVLSTLTQLRDLGWRHAIVSNHVPELASIVSGLGLDPLIDDVFSSAITGYEKPHPEAFRIALRAADAPSDAWMVGDNPHADVLGAEAVGIRAILVRSRPLDGIRRHVPDLGGIAEIIGSP